MTAFTRAPLRPNIGTILPLTGNSGTSYNNITLLPRGSGTLRRNRGFSEGVGPFLMASEGLCIAGTVNDGVNPPYPVDERWADISVAEMNRLNAVSFTYPDRLGAAYEARLDVVSGTGGIFGNPTGSWILLANSIGWGNNATAMNLMVRLSIRFAGSTTTLTQADYRMYYPG